jgi:hypothetical protein
VSKETLIGKILDQTAKADPSLDFKMESPLEDDKPKKSSLFPPKGSYSKAKITPVYTMNPLLLLQS